MKIMLINPKIPVYLRMPAIPLGLVSIASFMKAHGHEICFVERCVKNDVVSAQIKQFKPDIIGISAMSFLSGIDAKKITKQIRKYTKSPVVWGGQAPGSEP